ncbi:hypothetical protein D3C73_1282570 [compost metagenome]
MAALQDALGRQVRLATQLHDALGQTVGVFLFLRSVLGEFRGHRFGVQSTGHEVVALVAQHTDDFRGQRFVQQFQHGFAVCAIGVRDGAGLDVLACLGADRLHVHVEWAAGLLGGSGCLFHIVRSSR